MKKNIMNHVLGVMIFISIVMVIVFWVMESEKFREQAVQEANLIIKQTIRYVEELEEELEAGQEEPFDASTTASLEFITSLQIRDGRTLFIADGKSGQILASTNSSLIDENLSLLKISLKEVEQYMFGKTVGQFFNKNLYVLRRDGDLIYGVRELTTSVYSERMERTVLFAASAVILILVCAVVLNQLIQNQAVSGIDQITEKVKEIADGSLDTSVEVENNLELQQLSKSINKLIRNTLKSTVKISQVIDMVDLSIGVFEISHALKRVTATEQLRHVLLWSEEEAQALYSNEEYFMARLARIRELPTYADVDGYQISTTPQRWVRIHMTDDGEHIVGVVMDVTDEVLERKRIEFERDHDVLTGLRNIRTFKHDVSEILLQKAIVKQGAFVMFDVDKFKEINDHYGHDWGDDYLRMFARFLKRMEEKGMITARRSGDEFCMFLYGFESVQEITAAMDEFYQMVKANEIRFPDMTSRSISISGGVALLDWNCEDIYTENMRVADRVLYVMKENGRGSYTLSNQVSLAKEQPFD